MNLSNEQMNTIGKLKIDKHNPCKAENSIARKESGKTSFLGPSETESVIDHLKRDRALIRGVICTIKSE